MPAGWLLSLTVIGNCRDGFRKRAGSARMRCPGAGKVPGALPPAAPAGGPPLGDRCTCAQMTPKAPRLPRKHFWARAPEKRQQRRV